MKTRIALACSLLVNLLLATWWLRAPRSATEPLAPPPALAASRARSATVSDAGDRAAGAAAEVRTNTVFRAMDWRDVESQDYRQYVANLRRIGCPESTIRDIILADVNKLYDEKKKAAGGAPRKFEFWKGGNPLMGMMGDAETLQQRKALETEKLGILKALGIEPDSLQQLLASTGGNPMDAMFDFLPEEKRQRVTKAMADFQGRMMESAKDAGADAGAVMKAQRDMEAAIKEVLSPEEFLDYQLRFSMTANSMRMQLAGFDPTEKEFLEVFKLRAAQDEKYPMSDWGDMTEAQQKERLASQKELDQAIRGALGESRYADYQRSQDAAYQQMHRAVTKANLAPTVANDLYEMKKMAEQHANEIRRRQGMSDADRRAALRAIRTETELSVQQALGPEAWEQFNRPSTTWWLRNLAP